MLQSLISCVIVECTIDRQIVSLEDNINIPIVHVACNIAQRRAENSVSSKLCASLKIFQSHILGKSLE